MSYLHWIEVFATRNGDKFVSWFQIQSSHGQLLLTNKPFELDQMQIYFNHDPRMQRSAKQRSATRNSNFLTEWVLNKLINQAEKCTVIYHMVSCRRTLASFTFAKKVLDLHFDFILNFAFPRISIIISILWQSPC